MKIRKMGVKKLVIYVDIDDDLGKIGLKTPIIGEKEVEKAISIASEKIPTDSDFNTLVVSYNIYKQLKNSGDSVEIALISGDQKGGIESQLKFSERLDYVLNIVHPEEGVVVVYDSPEDAKTLPIIQSRVKVIAIERVLVEQYRSVEETYALLGKYIRKALSDPRYSRIFLGVPGLILALSAILSLLNLSNYAVPSILFVIGVVMIIRGLRIDEMIESWWENSSIMVVSAILSLASVIVGLINVYLSYQQVRILSLNLFADLMLTFLPYGVFSIIVLFVGKAIIRAIERNIKIWHDVLNSIAVILIYFVIVSFLDSLKQNVITIQPFISLIASAIILISVYILISLIEKYKLK
ncbi:MAG: DUF373 family protein [Sulfolobaceae archaeon]